MSEAFPRGGAVPRPDASSAEDKKRSRPSPSAPSSSSAPAAAAGDFLFGAPKKELATAASSSSSAANKRSKGSKSDDASASEPEHVDSILGGGNVIHYPSSSKKSPVIEVIGFGKLTKGYKVLGVVRQVISPDLVLVSLPNMMTGYVLRRDESSPPLTLSLAVDDLLPFAVVDVKTDPGTNSKRVELSISPALLNRGVAPDQLCAGLQLAASVLSVEDHGLVCSLGLSALSSFLPFADVSPSAPRPKVGQVFQCSVKSYSRSSGVVQLRLPTSKELAERVAPTPNLTDPSCSAHTVKSLTPGMLLSCSVTSLARNGVLLSFMTHFHASIDHNHLGGVFPGSKWRDVFKAVKSSSTPLLCRLVAVDPATSTLRLSLLPHLVKGHGYRPSETLPAVGETLVDATVMRVDGMLGGLLAVPAVGPPKTREQEEEEEGARANASDADGKKATKRSREERSRAVELFDLDPEVVKARGRVGVFVHISDVADPSPSGEGGKSSRGPTDDAALHKVFKEGSVCPAVRVTATSALEGWVRGSVKPSSLEAGVLSYEAVAAGAVYRDVPIANMGDYGVIVQLGPNIRAVVSNIHLADVVTKAKDKALKIGNKITVRCLTIDAASGKCAATHKKSLVSDKTPPITSYASLQPNQVGVGFVTAVTPGKGITVTFYNNVHGFVSAKSLAEELGVEDVEINYKVGNVVQARVVKCVVPKEGAADSKTGKVQQPSLTLSLDLQPKEGLSAPSPAVAVASKQAAGPASLSVGSVLPGKSFRVTKLVVNDAKLPHALVTHTDSGVECKVPYDSVLDEYGGGTAPEDLANVASRNLKVGKPLKTNVLVYAVDKKDGLPILSLRETLVETVSEAAKSAAPSRFVPSHATQLALGSVVVGYVVRHDPKFGAFVRFLAGLTGIVPTLKKGLELPLLSTVVVDVTGLDLTGPSPKILLRQHRDKKPEGEGDTPRKERRENGDGTPKEKLPELDLNVGDVVAEVEVVDIKFERINVKVVGHRYSGGKARTRIHFSMMAEQHQGSDAAKKSGKAKPIIDSDGIEITPEHPFYNLKVGDILKNVVVADKDVRDNVSFIDLATKLDFVKGSKAAEKSAPILDIADIVVGQCVSGLVSASHPGRGLWVSLAPGLKGFVNCTELSTEVSELNNLEKNFSIGKRLNCVVTKVQQPGSKTSGVSLQLDLSVLLYNELASRAKGGIVKVPSHAAPLPNSIVVGRINRRVIANNGPAISLDIRGGGYGRVCITELADEQEWENMPLGRPKKAKAADDEDDGETDHGKYPDGKFVQAYVLSNDDGKVELSLRKSLLSAKSGSPATSSVPAPEVNAVVKAFVKKTDQKGCFLKLANGRSARVLLKDLSDRFLPDPVAMFPPGRLVAGKVKAIKNDLVDLNMRESALIADDDKLTFDDFEEGDKLPGIVTRVETYGVFVKFDNSDVSGLVHVSELSDSYIKDIASVYSSGDRVKAIVLKKIVDGDKEKLSLGLKASYFAGDENSDDDDEEDEAEDSSDMDVDDDDNDEEDDDEDDDDDDEDEDDDDEDKDEEDEDAMVPLSDGDADSLDSDDDEYVTKLAKRMAAQKGDDDDDSEDGSDSDDDDNDSEGSDSDDSDSDEEAKAPPKKRKVEADVGFSWDANASSAKKPAKKPAAATANSDEDSDDSDSDDSDSDSGSDSDSDDNKDNHKSRKKSAEKKREEATIAAREEDLASGRADSNPETPRDYERLLTAEPNSSELWIRYMAYHLSIADFAAARAVGERAVARISSAEEEEKLNVCVAMITLEMNYGSSASVQEAIDNAARHNNPKKVYLRACDLFEADIKKFSAKKEKAAAIDRADALFGTMCKKFKSKKKVWLAHMRYLLRTGRNKEASDLLKRSMQSLAEYKHVETVSKYALLEFEHGSVERGRTIFESLMDKNAKRLDLWFVLVDREVKSGHVDAARGVFGKLTAAVEGGDKVKYTEKQMKSIFKKWFALEQAHGDKKSQEKVKALAKKYVSREE